jgi:hypothetical protein
MRSTNIGCGSPLAPVARPTPETAIVSMHLVTLPKMRCNYGDYPSSCLVIFKSTSDLSLYFRLEMKVVRYLAYISYCNVPRIVVFDSYFRVS